MKQIFPILALLASGCLAQPQPKARVAISAVLNELESVTRIDEVAISPDGSRIAWVQQIRDARQESSNSAIYVLDWRTAGATPRRISAGDGRAAFSEHAVAWSPDGARLAFFSNRERGNQEQIYVAAPGGGAARRLTEVTGYLTDPRWSPDGSRIAILFAENAPSGGGPLEAVPAATGVIEGQVYNQRVAVVDAKTGSLQQVSPAALHVYEYDWSPDGGRFAAIAAPGPGDNNWWVAQLYTLPAGAGEARSIYKPGLQIALPRWSPDGLAIAFIEGLMSDAGFTGGDIFTIPAAGGRAVNRTPGRASSPSWIEWLSPGKLLFTETTGGGSAIGTLELDSGKSERLWGGDENVHAGGNFPNFSLARDGKTSAVIRSDLRHAPDIHVGPIGQWRRVTDFNAKFQPHWGEARSIEWSSEGYSVQGWLLYPQDYNPARRYPMVVEVHGGPAGIRSPRWPGGGFDATVLASQGYLVFFPNPRGSYGRGEAFTRANVKDFGGGDLRDILAGVDRALKIAPIDANRVGITGWSYGGYMTMWTVTQTNRFRAAVAGAGIANWQSYYGENSIDQWMIPYFGASVYHDPAVYAKSAPMTFIRNVKTPTLVVVGERDGECPAPQSYEFWHALRTLGVTTQLVVYAGEGHMFRSPENKRDVMERTVAWFDRYLR